MKSGSITQASLDLAILPPQFLKCQELRYAQPCLTRTADLLVLQYFELNPELCTHASSLPPLSYTFPRLIHSESLPSNMPRLCLSECRYPQKHKLSI